jgi:hypothetical protein
MKKATLPPDPEEMNNNRAAFAGAALRHFRCITGTDYDTALTDLLADLMHWCDGTQATARMHYAAETSASASV